MIVAWPCPSWASAKLADSARGRPRMSPRRVMHQPPRAGEPAGAACPVTMVHQVHADPGSGPRSIDDVTGRAISFVRPGQRVNRCSAVTDQNGGSRQALEIRCGQTEVPVGIRETIEGRSPPPLRVSGATSIEGLGRDTCHSRSTVVLTNSPHNRGEIALGPASAQGRARPVDGPFLG
jgi:hypothetical protein